MPISRYEIRNEYSLADSEVYRAVDKDDPEALLEGVAMAGLVGILRQLGDLAEFAAEIFHNLHEEVMVTAARGHNLMSRVQQLETEIPSIEKAFFSQSAQSSFFYHAGVDWHPNLRLDQNIVTEGNVPRFIMDSYEESRGPPRLFLLDKFDVAGTGACLRRYTDPSFYKVETSKMTGVHVQKEKKIHKATKKGTHWRNGETATVLQTSHSKLHQLFLEERAESGDRNPPLRVKLKRSLNGFPFDLKTGKSFMEKLLNSPSNHKVLHEVSVNSSPTSVTDNHGESGFEIFEATRSPPPSPHREENMLNPSVYEPIIDPYSYPSTAGFSSTLDKVTNEKVVAVDAQSQRKVGLTGYQSDIASEIENYVDAPSSIESESPPISDYPGTSAENFCANGFQCVDVPINGMIDTSSYHKNAYEDFQANPQSRTVVSDNESTVIDAVNHPISEFKQSMPCLPQYGSDGMLKAPETDETVFQLNGKEDEANLVLNHPFSPGLCGFESQPEDDSPRNSTGDRLLDEPNSESMSAVPDFYYHITDSSLNTSLYSLHEDAFNGKDQDSQDHIASTSNMLDDLPIDHTLEIDSPNNLSPGELEDEISKVHGNSPTYSDTASNGDSKVDNIVDCLDEDSKGSTDSPSHSSLIMGCSTNRSTDPDVENNHSYSSISKQISSESLNVPHQEDSPDKATEGLDNHAGVIPEEETTKNEIVEVEFLEASEVVGSQSTGQTRNVFPNDLEAPESHCYMLEDLEEHAGTKGTVEMDVTSHSGYAYHNSVDKLHKSDADKSNTTNMPSASDNVSLNKVVKEHDSCFEDSGTDELENDAICPSECHEEQDKVEKMGPTEISASGVETGFCNTTTDDNPTSVIPGIFPGSDLVSEAEYVPEMEQCVPDLSHLLPINHQPMLDHVVLPSNNPFSETNQITLGDLPPLPPLPPVEWMTGKLQHASSSIEGETSGPKEVSSHLFSPLNVPSDNVTSPLPLTSTYHVDSSSPTVFPSVVNSSIEETILQTHPKNVPKEDTAGNHCFSLEASALHETTDLPPTSKNEQQQQSIIHISEGISASALEEKNAENKHETTDLSSKTEKEGVSTSAAKEDGAENVNQSVKLQWPRNPLIEDVAVLNKSKLRKVTERIRPEIPKVDERDSFLDQIRTKSFNLRPPTSLRPSVRGPNTNLQVAAILEKANAIRQAFAGSDEDDSDSWSDS